MAKKAKTAKTGELIIKGMYCSACSSRIEKVVGRMDGVSDVSVNLTTERGKISFSDQQTDLQDIIHKINQIGFKAEPTESFGASNKDEEIKVMQRKFFGAAFLTIPLAWAMLAHFKWASFVYIPPLLLSPYVQFLITFPIQFIIGRIFYERAWSALKSGSTNMDVLVVISTSAAFLYSHYLTFTTPFSLSATEGVVLYYETSAFIITFILLGRLLEAKTKWKTTEALENLYDVQQKTATLLVDGKEIQVDVEKLRRGQTILVKPGDKIPIDGQVIDGYSLVDESLLTGESIPVEKKDGTLVYAGTINKNGLLTITITKENTETTLSQIIKIVEDAQVSKAPIHQFANKIASVFIPIVLVIALGTFSLWYFFLEPGYFNGALVKVIAVLIVACPCALGLAAPTSMMVGSGRAAQLGILFKEGKFIESLGKCDVICLDKTGTITSGVPEVTFLSISKQFESRQVVDAILAIERQSNHPLAHAIVKKLNNENRSLPKPKHVENMPGYGIKANLKNAEVIIASPTYFKDYQVAFPKTITKTLNTLKDNGNSIMIVTINNRFAAIIGLSDTIKSTSSSAITQLKQMGLDVILLTGDHHEAGRSVAKKVGIDKVYTQCTPVDKSNVIKQMTKKGHLVAMVGDGVNDAPALAVSDVGVAIGTGADVAIESGDVTIINDDLTRFVDALKVSRKTMTNIKQNFLWAFLYNIIMIPIAVFGILLPWLAGAAMAFSSIAVVLNSLRLKRVKL